MIEELLVEQLRDIFNAEGQLVKALPRMVKAARTEVLQAAFERHLEETKAQVERLTEVFGLVGVPSKGKTCKGMAGLIAEGEQVIEESQDLEGPMADLALIGCGARTTPGCSTGLTRIALVESSVAARAPAAPRARDAERLHQGDSCIGG